MIVEQRKKLVKIVKKENPESETVVAEVEAASLVVCEAGFALGTEITAEFVAVLVLALAAEVGVVVAQMDVNMCVAVAAQVEAVAAATVGAAVVVVVGVIGVPRLLNVKEES